MFTAILLGSCQPSCWWPWPAALKLYWLLIAAGFYLGVAGTVFAIGIPFSSAWYEPRQRGFANGVFGMGMVGTAVSAFLTPRLAASIGYLNTHFLIAGVMVVDGCRRLVLHEGVTGLAAQPAAAACRGSSGR